MDLFMLTSVLEVKTFSNQNTNKINAKYVFFLFKIIYILNGGFIIFFLYKPNYHLNFSDQNEARGTSQ